jgi:gliding motility-associated-like protein
VKKSIEYAELKKQQTGIELSVLLFIKNISSIVSILFLGIILNFSFGTVSFSQGSNCANADPFCTDNGASFPASTSTTAEVGPNYGCLLSQPNPAWYYLQIDNSGNIDITLTNSAGNDIDFICWGPYSNLGTACYPSNSGVDCSYSTAATEVVNIPAAVNGDYYLLMVTNFSGTATNISANQTGGSGSTDCSIVNPCVMVSGTVTMTNCYTSGTGFLEYDISGTVNYTDPPATGQLIVQDCYGNQQTFNPPFGTSTNFTQTGLPQTGNTCDFTAWFTSDVACTITMPHSAPPPITGFSINCVVGGGAVNGDITFDDTYTSGTLIVSVSDGTTTIDTIINLPAASPMNWSVSGLDPAANPYTIDYYYSDFPSCSSQITINCGCSANAGTTTSTITGSGINNYVLCEGDQIDITTNNDFVDPDDIGPLGTGPFYPFTPALMYVVYSCPPTPGIWPPLDPCYVGLLPVTNTMTDINNAASWANSLPGGPYTDLWYAQTNVYYWDGTTAVWNSNCWDVGPGIQITYLNPIATPAVPDCQNSDVTITLTGGYPEQFGGNFTASNLLPATASFVNTTTTHGGTIVINNLQDGDFWSFDVVDGNGCPITVVGGPFIGLPTANAGLDDTVCALTYALAGVASFGTGTWTGPAGITFGTGNSATSTVTATISGAYTLTWTEDNGGGCISIDQVTITFSDPSFTAVTVPAACGVSNGQIDMTASGGVGPYLFSIDNGITTQANGTFPGVATNNYGGWIEDAVGCQFTNNISVANSGSPIIDSVVVTNPSCAGDCDGQLIIYGSGGTAPYEYSLDGIVFTALQDTWTGLCDGNQPVWIQDASGCQNTDAGLLLDPPAISHSVVITDLQCANDGTGQLVVTGAGGTIATNYTYTVDDLVNPAIVQANGTFTGLVGATYTVTVTDDNGCSSTSNETINEPTPLTLTFSAFDASCAGLCDGSAIVIPAGGTIAVGYTYTWSGGIAGNVPNAAAVCSGTYDLTVTDDNGCIADTLAWDIIGPPAVTFSSVVVTDETCNGSCDGTISVTSAGATQFSIDLGPFGPGSLFSALCVGPHTITIQDANGCSNDTTVDIIAPPAITLAISPDSTICVGGTATITAAAGGGTAPFSYVWDTGEITATINPTPAGTQQFCVNVTDANGCPAPAQLCVTITVNPVLQVVALSDQGICPGDPANISALANGGDGNYTYTWDNGLGVGQLQTVSPAITTIYTVTASDGCETPDATASVTITVNPLPTVDFTPDTTTGCTPVTVNFTEIGQPAGSQCFWDFGDANAAVACGTVSNTYTAPGCYDVTLTVISDLGCIDQITYPSLICVSPYPTASFTFGPQPTSVLNPTINFTNTSTAADTYDWTFGTGGSLGASTETDPSFTFPFDNPGSYQACLLATSTFGCQDSICNTVVIDEEFLVYVPNAFTPDADNLNETFMPVVIGANPLQYEFLIFDRWGELIYESQILGQGWDGTYKGLLVKLDVYVWRLKVVNAMNNEKHEYKGHVTILK